jgi:hypothetical protein
VGKNLSVIFLDLLVHVLRSHNSYESEEESYDAESSKEVELAFDEADHRDAAFLIQASESLVLIINWYTDVTLPDCSNLTLVASKSE